MKELSVFQLGLVERPWSFTGGIVSRHFIYERAECFY